MVLPVVEDAFVRLSGEPVLAEFNKKRLKAAEHIAAVVDLADVYCVGDRKGTESVELSGVLDTLSTDTPSEGLVEAIEYADQNLDPKEKSQVYMKVVKCLVGSFETANTHTIDDENRNHARVNRNISRIDAVLDILFSDIDEEPIIDAYDASTILSGVVEDIRNDKIELYNKDKKSRDKKSVVDRIQWTRLAIFELSGPKSEMRNQIFIDALYIYADGTMPADLRERALSYAIEHCPSMKDVSLENIGRNTRYPTDTALKLLAATDDPEVFALALEMAIEDFTPFIANLKRSQAYLEDKKTSRQSSADILDDLSNSSLLQQNQQLEKLIDEVTSRIQTYDDEIHNITHEHNGFKYEIGVGVREVQSAIIMTLLPLLSSKRGQSLFGLVYDSIDDDMALPACSKNSFLIQCIGILKEAYKDYAQHGKQEYDANQLRDIRVFLNGLKQPVEVDR